MRFLALFLLLSMVFVSTFAGLAKANTTVTMEMQRGCMQRKGCCPVQSKNQSKGCNNHMCMVLSCSTFGFTIIAPLKISPNIFPRGYKATFIYKESQLSDYSSANWHPPKV